MAQARKKKKRHFTWRGQILSVFGLLAAVVFMPSTIIIVFGMMPTIVAVIVGKAGQRASALTVGAINMAGCTPFLLRLWDMGHTIDNAIITITNPLSIVVMWSAAGMGYMIDAALSGIVGTIVAERAKLRISDIEEYRKQLVERWGEEVTGEHLLDTYGFSVEQKSEILSEDDDK